MSLTQDTEQDIRAAQGDVDDLEVDLRLIGPAQFDARNRRMRELSEKHRHEKQELTSRQTLERLALTRLMGIEYGAARESLKSKLTAARAKLANLYARHRALAVSADRMDRMRQLS